MNSKNGIRSGVFLTALALLFFSGYFFRAKPQETIDLARYDGFEAFVPEVPIARNEVNSEELHAKNVFFPMRGEAAPKMEAPKSTAPKTAGSFELTGIFHYQDVRGALILVHLSDSDPKAPKPRRIYKAGEAIGDGYNLLEISEDQVTIGRQSEKIILPLKKKRECPYE